MKQVLLSLAMLSLLIGLPAFGGGWETSGDRAASPILTKPAKGPLHFNCTVSASRSDDGTRGDSWTYHEELTADRFTNGFASFTTESKEWSFLDGHRVTLSVRNVNRQDETTLTLNVLRKSEAEITTISLIERASRAKGFISVGTTVDTESNPGAKWKENFALSVSCYEVKPLPKN